VKVNEQQPTTTVVPDHAATTTVPLPGFVPPPSTPVTLQPSPGNRGGSASFGDGHGSDGTGSEPTTTSPPPPTTVPLGNQTFNSGGGSLTVFFDGSTLTLVSDTPASGYTAKINSQQPDDVEVEFRNAQGTWTIQVQVDNGQLTHQIFHDE
jgi:hypothetical protein